MKSKNPQPKLQAPIEALTTALHDADPIPEEMDFYRGIAIDIVTALETAGFAVVPIEATTAMRVVGGKALLPQSIDFADEVWRTMLLARPR